MFEIEKDFEEVLGGKTFVGGPCGVHDAKLRCPGVGVGGESLDDGIRPAASPSRLTDVDLPESCGGDIGALYDWGADWLPSSSLDRPWAAPSTPMWLTMVNRRRSEA